MSRAEYVAAFVVDVLMGTGGRQLPSGCPKAQLREVVRKAIADAEEQWPEFEVELTRLAASDAAGRLALEGARHG